LVTPSKTNPLIPLGKNLGRRTNLVPTGSMPQEVKPAFKKKKLDFKQIVQKSLQVAVVFKDDPTHKIDETEKAHIWQQLAQLTDMMPHSSQTPAPRFDRSGLVQGSTRLLVPTRLL